LPIDKLAQALMDILVKVDNALEKPEIKSLPANFDATLSATRSAMDDLGTAMRSFDQLAASLTSASGMVNKEMPETLARVRDLAAQVERSLESLRGVVGPNTATVLEFTRAVRELGDTAKAVRGLAGALERNPESLLLGKGANRK
jgi:ABC-type transporter Mla subunit MlaD